MNKLVVYVNCIHVVITYIVLNNICIAINFSILYSYNIGEEVQQLTGVQ